MKIIGWDEDHRILIVIFRPRGVPGWVPFQFSRPFFSRPVYCNGFAQDLGSGGSLSRPGKRLQFAKVFKWPVGEFVDWTIEPSKNGEMFRRFWYVYYVYQRANHSKNHHWSPLKAPYQLHLEMSHAKSGPLMTLGVTLCSHIRRSMALIGGKKKTRNSPSKHQNWSKKKNVQVCKIHLDQKKLKKMVKCRNTRRNSMIQNLNYGIVWVNDDTW